MSAQSFAVIGAGVAGLQAAAQLKQAGYQVTIFEKSADVGGVWQHNYTGYGLQVRKWHYEIPGYKWGPTASPKYPTGAEVQSYIKSYANDAGVTPLIKFNREVAAVRPLPSAHGKVGDNGWEVEWKEDGSVHTDKFGFVVVATGLFNEPVHPKWAKSLVSSKSKSEDSLWVVDAKDFTDAAVAKGKRVVVIGGGKTAHDVAVNVSQEATSSTLVARKGHWMAPQIVLGFLPLEFATYTRWSWALQPPYYAAGKVKKAAHTVFTPVKAAAWGLFGLLFPLHTSTPSKLVPRHGLLSGIYDTIGMVDSKKVSKAFKSGQVSAELAEVESVDGKKLLLSNGKSVEADIVVLATGYRPTARYLFPENIQNSAGYDGDNQWLYRNVLPAEVSNLAFIGLNATFQHVLTTALQSRWLVDVLKGDVKLPSHEVLLADIDAQKAWLDKYKWRDNNYVWAQHGKYHDALVKDIRGYTAAYSRWNVPAELFGYIYNQLYAPLFPGNQSLQAGIKAKSV